MQTNAIIRVAQRSFDMYVLRLNNLIQIQFPFWHNFHCRFQRTKKPNTTNQRNDDTHFASAENSLQLHFDGSCFYLLLYWFIISFITIAFFFTDQSEDAHNTHTISHSYRALRLLHRNRKQTASKQKKMRLFLRHFVRSHVTVFKKNFATLTLNKKSDRIYEFIMHS